MENGKRNIKNEKRINNWNPLFFRLLFFAFFSIFHFPFSIFAKTEIRDTEIETVISELVRPLAEAADIPTERMRVRVLSDNSLNAFIGGGTDVFINTGLITGIETGAELQAVLAHEIGHVALGHVVQLGARTQAETIRSVAMIMLGVGAMAMYNAQAGMGMLVGAGAMATQGLMAFTRDEERSADDYAVRLLIKAGVNPNALISIFEKMQRTNEGKINPNSISHPLTQERMKNIKTAFKNSELPVQNSELKNRNFKMIQAKLIGYLDSASRVKTLYPNSDTSNPALYARAIMRTRNGDFEGAKTGTLTLVSRSPDNPYFYELLGDIEFRSGRYDDAVSAYEKSLALLDNAPQIELALATVLSERKKTGDLARATMLSKRAILTEPLPLAYWVLAKSDTVRTDYYLAEFYYMMKDMKQAKKHAAKAMETVPKNSPEYIKAKDIMVGINN